MAVHNGSATVQAAIDSILSQTFEHFEFLILDDASTDDTWTLLLSAAARDERVQLLRHDYNMGLTRSLNRLVAAAQGCYIARQDADDVSTPDRLARQVAVFETHSSVALVTGNYAEIDAHGNILRTVRRDVPPAVAAWTLLFHNMIAAHSLVMLRRDSVERAGGYDESYTTAQDYALWLRLMDDGEIIILPDVLLWLRRSPDSVSEVRRDDQFANTVRASLAKLRILLCNETIGGEITAAEVAGLFGFWAPWKAPDSARLGAFNRRLSAIYRAFTTGHGITRAERRQIRRATARQYVYWLIRESNPLIELRLSLVAATWHPEPVLVHWKSYGRRWLSRIWFRLRQRLCPNNRR